MANLDDYLDWRNDIPFSVDPFNEVDNLLLSELVYTPFDEIVPGPSCKDKISLSDACRLFFSKFTEEEIMAKINMTKTAPFLMKKMVNSKRYSGIKLSGYVNEIDAEEKSQFACITFYLPDNTIYVAFRGTDDTLIGWQEDFNMCFSTGTGGQLKAVEYLNNNFSRTMKRIRVGGHSKGGNFAVYASAFCKGTVKDNIDVIYSNDGPGFVDEIIKSDEYKSIVKKIQSYIPNESIIGLLMGHSHNSTIIKSSSKGINQHDPMSWQITKNHFVNADNLKNSSILIDETIKKWVMAFDYETRNIFCNIIFESLSASGMTKFSDVTGSKLSSAQVLTKSISSLEKDQQQLIYQVILKLISSGGDTFKNSFLEKISNIQQKLPGKK